MNYSVDQIVKKLSSIAPEIHQNAVEHGFWKDVTYKDLPRFIDLIHSEWSEALDELQGEHIGEPWDGPDGKPEGFHIELIDGVIRILDLLSCVMFDFENYNVFPNGIVCLDEFELISKLHRTTSLALEVPGVYYPLLEASVYVCCWIQNHENIDPFEILKKKHEYNKTRPYKHGKEF